jgi:hypothetical protein
MNSKTTPSVPFEWLLVCLLLVCQEAFGQGAAFTYQGRLKDGCAAANGSFDLTFRPTCAGAPSYE